MSEPQSRSLIWASSLVICGIVLLLFNFGWLDTYAPWPQVVLASACAIAASAFFVGFARHRQEWWRLLPAWTLTALAVMVVTGGLVGADRSFIAAQVFAGLALAFANIYMLAREERWWAILPGGFMFVLAVMVAASHWIGAVELLAALLFSGLGLVFLLLYLLDRKRRQWWALIPGSVLLVFGVLALTANSVEDAGLVRWWPLLLIAVGLLVWVGGRRTPRAVDKLEINSAPRQRAIPPGATTAIPSTTPRPGLGEYTQPAPGTSIEILQDQ